MLKFSNGDRSVPVATSANGFIFIVKRPDGFAGYQTRWVTDDPARPFLVVVPMFDKIATEKDARESMNRACGLVR